MLTKKRHADGRTRHWNFDVCVCTRARALKEKGGVLVIGSAKSHYNST